MSDFEFVLVHGNDFNLQTNVFEFVIGGGRGATGAAGTTDISTLIAKPIPDDSDLALIADSTAFFLGKKITFAEIWTWVRGLADLVYQPLSTALSKITEAGGLPLWDGGAWPGGGGGSTITGQTIDGGAGTVGLAYYLTSTDDTWLLSTNATEATVQGQVGICSAANTIMFDDGLITLPAHGKGANGTTLHVGAAGAINDTTLVSGEFLKLVGTVEDSNTIRVSVDENYFEIGESYIDYANPVSVTTTATATIGKHHVCTGTTSDYTVALPPVSGNAGKLVSFEMAAALTKFVTLDGATTETIDGELIRVMQASEVALLLCDGVTWTKIGGKTLPMYFDGYSVTTQSTIPSGEWREVVVDTVTNNFGGVLNTTTGRLTPRRPGVWRFEGVMGLVATTGFATRIIGRFWKNGVLWRTAMEDNSYATAVIPVNSVTNRVGGTSAKLAVGDNISMAAYIACDSGTWKINAASTSFSGVEQPTW